MEEAAPRKIIHVDMDAFYAAVEQRDFPEYRGRPVIVGGAPDSRGVVATCSYEARAYGVRSAMPSSRASRLCPDAIFLRPRFDVYREVSRQIHDVLLQFTPQVEPISLDEAYLDVSRCPAFRGSATLIAAEIKRHIRARTGLVASAGVSYNKFLAKIASDLEKPDGLCVILPEQGPSFAESLPVGRIHGVGRSTEARLRAMGVEIVRHLKDLPLEVLLERFGKAGRHYFLLARGIDERPVVCARTRKSLGSETTFQQDVSDPSVLAATLRALAGPLLEKLADRGWHARTVTLKVRYADFQLVTRSRSSEDLPLRRMGELMPMLMELLRHTEAGPRKVRLIGVSFSGLQEPGLAMGAFRQMSLFD